jgi:Glyoxalase-like domain
VRIDHVVYAVSDLERAETRFAREYGLEAAGGGEHPAFGTRNRILPVGSGEYIELMAVADESSKHSLARVVSEAASEGDRALALCLRPDSLDATAKRLGLDITPGERRNPDGEVLRWRLAGLEAALGPERLPFFIDWQGFEERLDRQHADAARADGIAWVECGGDRERLAKWIGGDEVPVRVVDGEPGPRAVAVRQGADTVIVR